MSAIRWSMMRHYFALIVPLKLLCGVLEIFLRRSLPYCALNVILKMIYHPKYVLPVVIKFLKRKSTRNIVRYAILKSGSKFSMNIIKIAYYLMKK